MQHSKWSLRNHALGQFLPRPLAGRAAALLHNAAAPNVRYRGSLGQQRTHAPQQTAASLFDHFVGELQKVQRHFEAKLLCGFEVDAQLELDRRLRR
jgi:hypothetical protein